MPKIAESRHQILPWNLEPAELFRQFKTQEKGLSEQDAEKRLKQYGFNELKGKDKKSAWRILLEQFINPLVLVLIAATVIAFFLNEKTDAYIIFGIVIINAILGFVQEFRAEKTVRELRKLISQEAKVLRGDHKKAIDARYVVPGDIVFLNIGDIVPADIRLLQQEEITLDEASLTGESVPVPKVAETIKEEKPLPQHLRNMALMGTHVASGEGYGVVVATAEQTFFGKTASYLKEPETVSDFEKSIGDFSKLLLKIILVMTVIIFGINAFLQHGYLESFLFALALAVGITPEALPIIITISLSKGAQKLAKAHVVVKKLASIEDLGNMDILCTDKTGTLTEGKLSLESYVNVEGKNDEQVLLYAMLCNEAVVSKHKVEGNIIDRAIWESPYKNKLVGNFYKYKILDRNEFDFTRRRMSAVVKAPDGKRYLLVKGAMESLFPLVDHILLDGKKEPLHGNHRTQLMGMINEYRQKGYTTISIAFKEWNQDSSKKEDEIHLTYIGLLTFIDPPRETARAAIREMEKMGVAIKVLSGDDPLVTHSICQKVNLKVVEDKIFTGDELDGLREEEFKEVVKKYNVFARIAPEHKYRIVKTLNTGRDMTIAFMGDGVNDAPAIKVADVGISVNTATGIAKEAADIILLQKSLTVIVTGIREGRRIFANLRKYILNTVSANYGNMFTVAASSLFLKFIPLLPSQILLNNLITDTPMLAIATDNVDEETLKKPKKLDLKMIRTFMYSFGLLSTIFDMTLILTLLFVMKAEPSLFRTAWFFESALSEVMVTFAIRSGKPFYKSRPGTFLMVISGLIVMILLSLVYSPLGGLFELVSLNFNMLLFILGIVVCYFVTAEIVKKFFFKKFEF